MASIKNIVAWNLGARMTAYDIKKLQTLEIGTLFPDNEMRLTIMLEVGLINRSSTVGNYSSYSRCIRSIRTHVCTL